MAAPSSSSPQPRGSYGLNSESPRDIETVSVIIPAYNAAATIRACVASVLRSQLLPLEILVVDDHSSDDTREQVAALAKGAPTRVAVVALAENRGPATARNRGAEAAEGSLLFFLDADTELDPEALGFFLESIKGVDAVSGVFSPQPLNEGPVPRYKALFDAYNFSARGRCSYDSFSAYCAGVRASVYARIGGFNEDLLPGMEYELEDFGYRLTKEHEALIDPAIRARHHFAGFGKLTRGYVRRVSQWMGLFVERRRFETAGDATASLGLATVCLPLGIGLGTLSVAVPVMVFPSGAAVYAWWRGYEGFFRYVAEEAPGERASVIALAGYFSCVISVAAAWGVVASTPKLARYGLSRLLGTDPPMDPGTYR